MTTTLRIATFNLENLDRTRPGVRPTLEERIAVLRPQMRQLDADILCLQEVNGQRAKGEKAWRLLALDDLLAGTPYADYVRVETHRRSGKGALDIHNLVILSRYPIRSHSQYWHDLVPPPAYAPVTAEPAADDPLSVTWDRPVLHAAVDVGAPRPLHVFNLHLRSPLAAVIAGQKTGAFSWKSVSGWAEGFYLAALKRSGQALEARLAIDRLFDEDPRALIVATGDFNASAREVPVRIVMGHEDDTGSHDLAGRALVPLEQQVPAARRYSVIHDGRAVMLDHVLVSAAMWSAYRGAEIHNAELKDEIRDAAAAPGSPVSYHAPVVASFAVGGD
ncbi:MAG: endonuclease/exonuclease/phosphatase family protein [Alphaproteobacteria bacterium]|nr:endonuclease/exonuclease/phosphatase family protein [Alphaproteobacteria bacterium]